MFSASFNVVVHHYSTCVLRRPDTCWTGVALAEAAAVIDDTAAAAVVVAAVAAAADLAWAVQFDQQVDQQVCLVEDIVLIHHTIREYHQAYSPHAGELLVAEFVLRVELHFLLE